MLTFLVQLCLGTRLSPPLPVNHRSMDEATLSLSLSLSLSRCMKIRRIELPGLLPLDRPHETPRMTSPQETNAREGEGNILDTPRHDTAWSCARMHVHTNAHTHTRARALHTHTYTCAQTVGLSPPLRVMHDRSAENLCLCRERGDDPFIRYQNMEILLR